MGVTPGDRQSIAPRTRVAPPAGRPREATYSQETIESTETSFPITYSLTLLPRHDAIITHATLARIADFSSMVRGNISKAFAKINSGELKPDDLGEEAWFAWLGALAIASRKTTQQIAANRHLLPASRAYDALFVASIEAVIAARLVTIFTHNQPLIPEKFILEMEDGTLHRRVSYQVNRYVSGLLAVWGEAMQGPSQFDAATEMLIVVQKWLDKLGRVWCEAETAMTNDGMPVEMQIRVFLGFFQRALIRFKPMVVAQHTHDLEIPAPIAEFCKTLIVQSGPADADRAEYLVHQHAHSLYENAEDKRMMYNSMFLSAAINDVLVKHGVDRTNDEIIEICERDYESAVIKVDDMLREQRDKKGAPRNNVTHTQLVRIVMVPSIAKCRECVMTDEEKDEGTLATNLALQMGAVERLVQTNREARALEL